MDVAVELSASLLEVYEKARDTDKTVKSLWSSGVNIGRDMMGTMSNTLVMAYIGNSLSTILLLLSYSDSLIELFNREMIIVELLQILVGSFGLLLTIPFTSLICSIVYCKSKKDLLWAKSFFIKNKDLIKFIKSCACKHKNITIAKITKKVYN